MVILPKERVPNAILAAVLGLLFPVTGVIRGCKAISSMAVFGRNNLEVAARSGALYMVNKKGVECMFLRRVVAGVAGGEILHLTEFL